MDGENSRLEGPTPPPEWVSLGEAAFRSKLKEQIVMAQDLPRSLRNQFQKSAPSFPGPAPPPGGTPGKVQGRQERGRDRDGDRCSSVCVSEPRVSQPQLSLGRGKGCFDPSLSTRIQSIHPLQPQFSLVASTERRGQAGMSPALETMSLHWLGAKPTSWGMQVYIGHQQVYS